MVDRRSRGRARPTAGTREGARRNGTDGIGRQRTRHRCWGPHPSHRYDRGVANRLPDDLVLHPIGADSRPVGELLTTFHLAPVVLDPYTNESSWILKTAVRVLDALRGADARVSFVVTSDADDARRFLGPIADDFLVFADPDLVVPKALGATTLPAFAFVRVDGSVEALTEGWDPAGWRSVARAIAAATSWNPPTIPGPNDPAPFAGSPVTG